MIESYVEIAMLVLMLTALIGGLVNRWHLKKGMSYRFIQFVGVAWLIGATVILAPSSQLDGTAGTILGAVAGYLFGMRRGDD